MERAKMPREQRAKQFAPFDALKGLQEAIRLKEYEQERIQKGDISEERAEEISNLLIRLNKNDLCEITYFEDGHNKKIEGMTQLIIEEQCIKVETLKKPLKIKLDDIVDIINYTQMSQYDSDKI